MQFGHLRGRSNRAPEATYSMCTAHRSTYWWGALMGSCIVLSGAQESGVLLVCSKSRAILLYWNIVMRCSRYWCVALGNADSKRTRPQHSGGAVPSNTSSISHFCRVLPVFHFVPVAIVRVCLKISEDLQTLSSSVIYFHWTIFIKKMSGTDKDPLLSLTTRWAQSFLSGSRIILSLYFINPICREI